MLSKSFRPSALHDLRERKPSFCEQVLNPSLGESHNAQRASGSKALHDVRFHMSSQRFKSRSNNYHVRYEIICGNMKKDVTL